MGIAEIRALKSAKTGTKMTAKEFQEFAKSVKVGSNPMAGKFKSGHYETAKGTFYFRSLTEANYALYLDWLVKQGQIKDWQYEADIFFFEGIKMGTNCYKPDWKVFNNDGTIEYHETKGYMRPQDRTKLKRMAKYHPSVKLILIDVKAYREIYKRMKSLIKFYQ